MDCSQEVADGSVSLDRGVVSFLSSPALCYRHITMAWGASAGHQEAVFEVCLLVMVLLVSRKAVLPLEPSSGPSFPAHYLDSWRIFQQTDLKPPWLKIQTFCPVLWVILCYSCFYLLDHLCVLLYLCILA